MAGPYQVLAAKRAGERLSDSEIRSLVQGASDGSWTDGQLGAFLMAAVIQGLDPSETRALTAAMLGSGERWQLEQSVPHLCDKHSTGGVGDKVSLILSPILAASGLPVAMLTGRGLAHTGGTADKLETIPGLDLALDRPRTLELVERVGMAIGIATSDVAPADRRLYGLRNATATVDSLPLITASILSKKLATGAAGLVLDVKTGSGAVADDVEVSRLLARALVDTAVALGCPTSALLTDMSQPLGRWVGNSVEIRESIECLEGRGPAPLMEVVLALCVEVSSLAGRPLARERLLEAVDSGAALETFGRWVAAQGGDAGALASVGRAPAPHEAVIRAERSGYLRRVACRRLGFLLVEAGAGRTLPTDEIDPDVGLHYTARLGDRLEPGDEIARAYLRRPDADWERRLGECFELAEERYEPPAPVGERIGAS